MTEQAKETADIIVSFEGVKVKDFRVYWRAVARNDWAGQDAFFAKVVKRWPFAGDPSEPKSYVELEIQDFFRVQHEIRVASSAIVSIMNAKDRLKGSFS